MALVGAALHLTMTSSEMTLCLAAKYPDVQQRVFEELTMHYERHGTFAMQKMRELHVFRAFVWEALRFGHPANATLPRTATANCKVGPYNVPRGTDLRGA